jgi:putative ABC transport system permease protein
VPVYVSEAMVSLHGAALGSVLMQKLPKSAGNAEKFATEKVAIQSSVPQAHAAPMRVMGIWRDYARQHGSVWVHRRHFAASPDGSSGLGVSDLSMWPKPGVSEAQLKDEVVQRVSTALGQTPAQTASVMAFASATEIRSLSLKIFDRSFAVTVWLQAVAVGIGLFGVAASFSAQALARRKEFGLLAHLGFTRSQVLRLVAAEGALWSGIGAVAGVALGLVIAAVLIDVVNPQSFHWTMDTHIPWSRLGALAASLVLAAGVSTWLAARSAVNQHAVMAVKEDW